ncbi:MAG: hypothetical protein WC796_03135 [Candidatus Pacearchaeota archaeon]|jgi:hypothetical protein
MVTQHTTRLCIPRLGDDPKIRIAFERRGVKGTALTALLNQLNEQPTFIPSVVGVVEYTRENLYGPRCLPAFLQGSWNRGGQILVRTEIREINESTDEKFIAEIPFRVPYDISRKLGKMRSRDDVSVRVYSHNLAGYDIATSHYTDGLTAQGIQIINEDGSTTELRPFERDLEWR